MPRDIRSYFTPVATSQKKSGESVSKPQKRRVISSDEDEEQPKSSIKRSKIKQKPKKASVLSDSEDDMPIVENEKKDFKQSKKSKENEKRCIAISPGDLFSKKPVTRIEETKASRKLQKVESEFHDDDDFDAVLKQLDKPQDIVTDHTKKNRDSIKNTENDSLKSSKSEIESGSNNNKKVKHNASSENSHNEKSKKNKTKTDKLKKSPTKNNTHTKAVINLPSEQKLQKKKNNSSSSNDDLNTSYDKPPSINNASTQSKDMSVTVSTSKNKEEKDRKKAKEIDLFEERVEKKKQRAVLYEKYLQRGGARNPGTKEVPKGAENCLAGITFLITGVLDSLERNEAEDLIQSYGGRTVNAVSGKVNYILVGDEAGPAKLTKANSLGIKQISEDDLLEMIRTRPEGKSEHIIKPVAKRMKPNAKIISDKSDSDKSPSPKKVKLISPKKEETSRCTPEKIKTSPPMLKQTMNMNNNSQETTISIGSQPLVEKYRPKTMKQIIGQQGDNSCARKLYTWLRDWHKNRQDPKFKDGTGKQTNGQTFKAALLSGPPGVGKTTTVQVVCKELGYDLLEFNASDTRNKTLLKEEVSGLLSNTTMKDYFTGNNTTRKITSKHVLLMDEVDGMAGNEDRGGLQELVYLMKFTEVPIICICNDRFNTKVKTISYHSYDLRFPKLRVEQIRGFMRSMCYKENLDISTDDLDRLIESTNHDIRQVINHLEFLGGKTARVEATDKKHSNKNFKLGPFDVAKMVFKAEEQKNMNLNDKIGLYFNDYNIAPLFVQENYLSVRLCQVSPLQRLEKIARAADSISQGDLIEKVMRGSMMWSLLPLHACFSFIIPGSEMSGSLDSLVRFPSWFGRNSKATKFNRLMQELTTHTRLSTGASKEALNLDYLVHIRNSIIKPLIDNGAEGIEAAINVMGKYHLMREDLDSMIEISTWPGIREPSSSLDSKVKAAFTRAYQKNLPMLPYAINSSGTAKKRPAQDDDIINEDDEEEEDIDSKNDIDSDKMIKAKKPSASTSKTATASTSTKKTGEPVKKRGRGRGKAK